ncbi:MAG: hypothetical protein N4A47_05895 [Clostridia bacterium]|jgi:uncharacterized membrane protein|nr:hypothetical protein [Clostridia bacterium]
MGNKFDELEEKELSEKRRVAVDEDRDIKEIIKNILVIIVPVPLFIILILLMFLISFGVFFSGVMSVLAAIFGMIFSLEYITNVNNVFWLFLGLGNIMLGVLMSLGTNFVRGKLYVLIKKMLGMEV